MLPPVLETLLITGARAYNEPETQWSKDSDALRLSDRRFRSRRSECKGASYSAQSGLFDFFCFTGDPRHTFPTMPKYIWLDCDPVNLSTDCDAFARRFTDALLYIGSRRCDSDLTRCAHPRHRATRGLNGEYARPKGLSATDEC